MLYSFSFLVRKVSGTKQIKYASSAARSKKLIINKFSDKDGVSLRFSPKISKRETVLSPVFPEPARPIPALELALNCFHSSGLILFCPIGGSNKNIPFPSKGNASLILSAECTEITVFPFW